MGVRGYRCRASQGHFARMAEPVEQYVEALVTERLSRPDARSTLMPTPVDLKPLHTEGTTLRERLTGAANDYADGAITGQQLRAITERIRGRLDAIDQELADAQRDHVLAGVDASTWTELPTERKRAIIDLLMTVTLFPPGRGTRTFRPETVGIEWNTAE